MIFFKGWITLNNSFGMIGIKEFGSLVFVAEKGFRRHKRKIPTGKHKKHGCLILILLQNK